MTALALQKLTFDEFLSVSEDWEGRWELVEGEPLKLEAERVDHLQIKLAAVSALSDAIRRAKAPCQAFPDGATVRISRMSAFRPDALVRCGSPLPPDMLEIPDPLIVVEVISPSSEGRDFGAKVDGYFSVATIQHYLVLIPELRRAIHFRRGSEDAIERRLVRAPALRLDPPGLDLDVAALFPPA